MDKALEKAMKSWADSQEADVFIKEINELRASALRQCATRYEKKVPVEFTKSIRDEGAAKYAVLGDVISIIENFKES